MEKEIYLFGRQCYWKFWEGVNSRTVSRTHIDCCFETLLHYVNFFTTLLRWCWPYVSPFSPRTTPLICLNSLTACSGKIWRHKAYLLTTRSRVVLEKLTGSQLVNKFPAFYGTQRFITAFTSARHRSYQSTSPGLRLSLWIFRNNIRFYGEELLAPRPTPKLEDHPLSNVRDCLFNIFACTLHIRGRSSIRNLRTRHAVVTGTHLYKIVSFIVPLRTAALVGYAGGCMFLCGKTGEHRDNIKRTSNLKQTPDCHLMFPVTLMTASASQIASCVLPNEMSSRAQHRAQMVNKSGQTFSKWVLPHFAHNNFTHTHYRY